MNGFVLFQIELHTRGPNSPHVGPLRVTTQPPNTTFDRLQIQTCHKGMENERFAYTLDALQLTCQIR